jgi:sterol desaturase/sphingolipid hydroxylase (fatty acid hydroxylase superfamily)
MNIYAFAYDAALPVRTRWLGDDALGWNWWVWLVALVLDDLTFYWFHRMAHRVRFMWASHVVHHSSTHFNFTTGARLAWFSALYKPFLWAWIPALGIHPLMVAACAAISSLYQFFCHTDHLPAWNRLSWLLVTPGLHVVHHARDEDCIDRNYAAVFSF